MCTTYGFSFQNARRALVLFRLGWWGVIGSLSSGCMMVTWNKKSECYTLDSEGLQSSMVWSGSLSLQLLWLACTCMLCVCTSACEGRSPGQSSVKSREAASVKSREAGKSHSTELFCYEVADLWWKSHLCLHKTSFLNLQISSGIILLK